MKTKFKTFNELSVSELHKLYYLRCLVFVVEQNCAYQDIDEEDTLAIHVLLLNNTDLNAYARILAPSKEHDVPRIGRVVVHPKMRAKGFGKIIMKESIKKCKTLFPNQTIHISAQAYLSKFYHNLGFEADGTEYLEDGIPHLGMNYKYKKEE